MRVGGCNLVACVRPPVVAKSRRDRCSYVGSFGFWVLPFKEIHRRASRSEIGQFYIFLGLFYLFILWLVIALKFDRLHPR